MPVTRPKAREICTKPEMELVDASYAPTLTHLTPARLRTKIERARKLQDKYRDLGRSQGRALKGKGSDRRAGGWNARTQKKERLFDETRQRFEKRLAQLESQDGEG